MIHIVVPEDDSSSSSNSTNSSSSLGIVISTKYIRIIISGNNLLNETLVRTNEAY